MDSISNNRDLLNKILKVIISFAIIISLLHPIVDKYGRVKAENPESDFTFVENSKIPGTVSITKYTGTIKDVVIPEYLGGSPVTEIGASAFASKQLTSVELPRQLVTIGNSAFQSNKIKTIVFPQGVTSVGTSSFASNSIVSLSLNYGLLEIKDSAFVGMSSGAGNSLEELTLPDTVTTIGNYAFRYNKINTLYLSKDLKTIGNQAFEYNLITGKLEIPEGVTKIGTSAFAQTNQITDLVLPSTLIEIGGSAFLKNNLTKIVIPEGVQTIGSSAFYLNPNLTDVYLPRSMTGTIGATPFRPTTTYTSNAWVTIYGYSTNKALRDYLATSANKDHPFVNLLDLSDNSSPNDVSDFTYTKNSTAVTIIGYIGARGNVVIPDTIENLPVKTIASSAFKSNKISSVVIPDSVNNIQTSAFEDNLLSDIKLPKSLTSIGANIFRYNKFTNVKIPEGITTIGGLSFGNNEIDSITIPSTVTSITSTALDGNQTTPANLTVNGYNTPTVAQSFALTRGYTFNSIGEVYYPEEENDVSDFTYTKNESSITVTGYTGISKAVNIPSYIEGLPVTELGYNSFASKSLSAVKLPETLISIGDYAFNSNKLVEINIPTSVTKIGSYSFSNNLLKELILHDNVKSVDKYGFYNNRITALTLSKNMTYLEDYVFGNNQISEVEIPYKVNYISINAFDNNQRLPGMLILKSDDSNPLTKNFSEARGHTYVSTGNSGELMFTEMLEQHKSYNYRLSTSQYHSVAVTTSGDVYTWGGGLSDYHLGGFVLGLGSYNESLRPTKVPNLKNIIAVQASQERTTALDKDGYVYTFGKANLGLGDLIESSVPVKVEGISDVVAISSRWRHTLALTSNGDVYAWGNNDAGKLGLGDTITRKVPTKIESLKDVVGISAGVNHSVVTTKSGEIFTFGVNAEGELGIGNTTTSFEPVKIPNLVGAKHFMAGEGYYVGDGTNNIITRDGSLYFFGDTGYLGSSSYAYNDYISTPRRVTGVEDLVSFVDQSNKHTTLFTNSKNELLSVKWGEAYNPSNKLYDKLGHSNPPTLIDTNVNRTLTSRGNVYMQIESDGGICVWGDNRGGVHGNGKKTSTFYEPYSKTRSCIEDFNIGVVSIPTDPTEPIDPTNPTDPNSPPTDGDTGDVDIIIGNGELKIIAPEVKPFGINKIPKDNTKVLSDFQNDLEILDSRGTGEGWRVTLTASEFSSDINGSKYYLPAGRLKMSKPTNIINQDTGDSTGLINGITSNYIEIDGTGPIVVASAEVGYGKGTTLVDFNNINTLELSLFAHELLVNKLTNSADYTSTLTWTVTEAP